MEKRSKLHAVLLVYGLIEIVYGIILLLNKVTVYGALWCLWGLLNLVLTFILRKKRILPLVLSLLLIAGTFCSAGILVFGRSKISYDEKYVLVLGFALDNDRMTETLKMRCDRAAEYARENEEAKLILCGGITKGNSVSEAQVMHDYLISQGISEQQMELEDRSLTTVQNIQNAASYISKSSDVIVLSSNYHLLRARMICQRCGIIAKGLAADAPLLTLLNDLKLEMIKIVLSLVSM